MARNRCIRGDITGLRTPCYVIDRGYLQENLDLLDRVQSEAGCKILLALKGFATWSVFDQVKQVLPGAAASSLFHLGASCSKAVTITTLPICESLPNAAVNLNMWDANPP